MSRLGPLRPVLIRAFSVAGLQVVLQAGTLVAGLVATHLLTTGNYAEFTIANSSLGSMLVLVNLGITVAIDSIGGRVHGDRRRFGGLVRSCLRMRTRLAMIAVPLVLLVQIVVLHRTHTPLSHQLLLGLAVVAAFACDLRSAIYAQVLLLTDHVRSTQIVDIICLLLRLGLMLLAMLLLGLDAVSALWATVGGLFLRTLWFHRLGAAQVDLDADEVAEDTIEVRRLVRLQAVNGIYYCIQGNLTIWILAFVAQSSQVADFGALARFGAITTFLTALVRNILVPPFARIQEPGEVRRRQMIFIALLVLPIVGLIAAGALMPGELLWVLGPGYVHIDHGVVLLMMVNLSITFLGGSLWNLNAARAWIVMVSYFGIPATIIMQVIGAMTLDLHTLRGAIIFSILTNLPSLALCIIDTCRGPRAASGQQPAAPAVVEIP